MQMLAIITTACVEQRLNSCCTHAIMKCDVTAEEHCNCAREVTVVSVANHKAVLDHPVRNCEILDIADMNLWNQIGRYNENSGVQWYNAIRSCTICSSLVDWNFWSHRVIYTCLSLFREVSTKIL